MVYGPIAAFLVEFFAARIRYTSMSLPYHIGNGWFGGFLPLIAAALLTSTGNLYAAGLPDHRRADHGRRGRALHPREPARPDLGRSRWPRRGAGDRGATCAAPRHPESIALKTLLRPRRIRRGRGRSSLALGRTTSPPIRPPAECQTRISTRFSSLSSASLKARFEISRPPSRYGLSVARRAATGAPLIRTSVGAKPCPLTAYR